MNDATKIQYILDRQDILDCLTRYSRGMDRGDAALCKSAYHEDAWDEHGFVSMRAHEIVDFGMLYHAANRYTQHILTNHSCEIDGDVAHTETYFVYVGCYIEDKPADLRGGRYLDRLERREGAWKIATRLCLVEWEDSFTEPATVQDPRSARAKTDASYMRPLKVPMERRAPDL